MQVETRQALFLCLLGNPFDQLFCQPLTARFGADQHAGQPRLQIRSLRKICTSQCRATQQVLAVQCDQAAPITIGLPFGKFPLPFGQWLMGIFVVKLAVDPLGVSVAVLHVVGEPFEAQGHGRIPFSGRERMRADPLAHWQPPAVFRDLYKIPPFIGESPVYGLFRRLEGTPGGRGAIVVEQGDVNPVTHKKSEVAMPKFVIEREIPGAGKLSEQELKAVSQTSCNVLRELGPEVQWLQSYVTADKIYCVYIAPNEELVREHARQGGFPANSVSRVTTIIDPTTAE